MIYIAKDHNGQIIGIVSADNEKSVNAYFQGKDDLFNTLEKFDLSKDRENEKMGYVTPILKTMEVDVHRLAHETKSGKKVRIQVKN